MTDVTFYDLDYEVIIKKENWGLKPLPTIAEKNINLIILFIKDIIAIENKLSPGTRFTPAQTSKFKQVKDASGSAVEFKVKFDKVINGIPIFSITDSFQVSPNKVLKFSDHGTNEVGRIGLDDLQFIKNLNF